MDPLETSSMTTVPYAVFAVTEPPLKLLRRFIPPLRLGGVAIDIAFIVLFLLVQILIVAASRF